MNATELKGRGVLAERLARAEIQGENRTVNGVGELKLREVRGLAKHPTTHPSPHPPLHPSVHPWLDHPADSSKPERRNF